MNENQIKILAGSGLFVSGLLFGGLGGYFIDKKKMSTKFNDAANAEIADVKAHYQKLLKTGVYSSPVTLFVEKYGDKVEELGYDTEQAKNDAPVEELRVERTEFDVDEPDHKEPTFNFVHDDELVSIPRDRTRPYVISVAEFMEDEDEFDKISIIYYEGDKTLSDERDEILDDINMVIGPDALSNFGTKSDDEHIVYIRNERLRSDFEVFLDERKFVDVALGYGDRVRHQSRDESRQDE